jgi:PAS domain-containing protein
MQRICGWCGKDLGELKAEPDIEYLISHGICDDCAFHLLAEVGMPLREYLDHLAAPVLIVDGNGAIKTANKMAQALLQKDLPELEGYLGGVVFECVHSTEPEGCGQTIHCSGCTVRRTVMETLHTGKNYFHVPAYLDCNIDGCIRRIHYLISTEKLGEIVLLRVDEVNTEKNGGAADKLE